jgi:hypothetical protein
VFLFKKGWQKKKNFGNWYKVYNAAVKTKGKKPLFISPPAEKASTEKLIPHQIVFALDATASMSNIIEDTKAEIKAFAETLTIQAQAALAETYEISMEVAVVAYRDLRDVCQFETIDFTPNMGEVEKFLGKVKAKGGDDTPEDVEGAFIQILFGNLSWKDCASRTIIWVADAPPHGKEFNNLSDDFPFSCMEEWKIIFNKMHDQKISLIIGQINESTDNTNDTFKSLGKETGVSVDVRNMKPGQKETGEVNTYSDIAIGMSENVSSSSQEYVMVSGSK